MDNEWTDEQEEAAKELLKYIEEHPESLNKKSKVKSVEDYALKELAEALLTPIEGTKFKEEDFIPDDKLIQEENSNDSWRVS